MPKQENVFTDEGYGRFTKEEIVRIKGLFSDESNLKLLRKVFLPGLDTNAGVGQLMDPWSASSDGIKIQDLTAEECKIYFLSREQLLRHLELQLQVLQVIAQMREETEQERKERELKNSTR